MLCFSITINISKPYFIIMCSRNFNCRFLMLSKSVLFVSIFCKTSSFLTIFMVFPASFWRTMFLLHHFLSSSARRLTSIHWQTGRPIWHNSLTLFCFYSNKKLHFLNHSLNFWKASSAIPMGLRISVIKFPSSLKILPMYVHFCTCSILVFKSIILSIKFVS